jgi:hypothetical protein
LDLALIDGPHGYPFADMEYYFIYQRLKPGAFLIIDDLQIPNIGAMWNIIKEEEMFNVHKVIGDKTGILQRTDAAMFNPLGDGWWEHRYNRRRMPRDSPIFLED